MNQSLSFKMFNIKKTENCAIIKISNQTYLKIFNKAKKLMLIDRSKTDVIKFINKPNTYYIESDGKINSIDSIKEEIESIE